MGGGIIQLVAQGIHDVHITGNPQITFFKQLYKRHTVFAMERFQQYPPNMKRLREIEGAYF